MTVCTASRRWRWGRGEVHQQSEKEEHLETDYLMCSELFMEVDR